MPRRIGIVLAACVVVAGTGIGSAAARDAPSPSVDGSPDTTYVYDLENEPSNCIGFLPRPDCGKAPQQAGDRGGALQFALFGILMAGLGVIGAVVVRNVVRRDRAMNDALAAAESAHADRR